MKKIGNKIWCLALVSVLTFSTIAGCGNKSNVETGNQVQGGKVENSKNLPKEELKIMFRADKPTGWDEVETAVEEKLAADGLNIDLLINWVAPADYKEKLNLAITGGEEWDLVFDATFIYLRTLAADGYYADLSSYWNNNEYPGLKECFSETLIENNQFYGQKNVIPLLRTYGTGIQAVHYRQDWADEWGIGVIDSYEKLVKYWDACLEKKPGVYPLGVTGARGFYQLLGNLDASKSDIQMIVNSGVNYYVHIEDGKVNSIAAEGTGDEAFKDFPEPYNYDFGVRRYEEFAKWREAGYIETDSLNQTDEKTMFYSGLSASIIGTLDDVEKNIAQMATYSSEGVIGEFLYNERVRNMEEAAIATGYQANNFLCVPANSKKIDTTMKFLNWIFSNEENHDLIELGIEGKDWINNGDGTYKVNSQYSFPGYMLTWTSKYVKFADSIPEDILKYRKYELLDSTFYPNVLPGFNLDVSGIATETAQVKGITDMINTVKLHGILSDGSKTYDTAASMLKTNLDQAYKSGAKVLEDTIVEQVNNYLSNK